VGWKLFPTWGNADTRARTLGIGARSQIWSLTPAESEIRSDTSEYRDCAVAGLPSRWLVMPHGVAGHPSRLWFEATGVAAAGVDRLAALLEVEGVLSDQFAGEEDVIGGAGDDDGGGLAVVLGTD
jgi:hypothetical protein